MTEHTPDQMRELEIGDVVEHIVRGWRETVSRVDEERDGDRVVFFVDGSFSMESRLRKVTNELERS